MHTKGPFHVEEIYAGEHTIVEESTGRNCDLALIMAWDGITDEEAEANAILFAASPDLLKALNGLITWTKETALPLLLDAGFDEEILPRGWEKWNAIIKKVGNKQ